MTEADFFVEENLVPSSRQCVDLGGKYSLVINQYRTKEGCWNFTRGQVYHLQSGEPIADVKRNYSLFWHCYVEHPNNHHYLLCGENYQGQTVIELDTGQRRDYLPEEAKKGSGFCWANVEAGSDNTKLKVEGCYWAFPYEEVIYDFSNPLSLPYKELQRRWVDEEEETEGQET